MQLDEVLTAGSGVYFEGTLIDSLQTPYQRIEVFETPTVGKLMRIDGANMTSEGDEFFYHEALVHPAAIAHEGPRQVLIIGGGDGGSSEEVLKHPSVERVVLVELDQGVVDMAKKHLVAVHRDVFVQPKLMLHIGDGAAFVHSTSDHFDLIYLDLTDPAGPAEHLYASTFYTDLRRLLNPGGALVLHIGAPFSHPQRSKHTVLALRSVFARTNAYFAHIPTYGAQWGFAVASDTLDVDVAIDEIERRLKDRKVTDRQFYNGEIHRAMFALPEYVKVLIR